MHPKYSVLAHKAECFLKWGKNFWAALFIHRPLADSIVTEAFSAHKRFADVIVITEFACKSDNVCFMLEVQLAAVSVVPEGYVYSSSLSDTFDVETFSELSKESFVELLIFS